MYKLHKHKKLTYFTIPCPSTTEIKVKRPPKIRVRSIANILRKLFTKTVV